jgi:predicted ATPase
MGRHTGTCAGPQEENDLYISSIKIKNWRCFEEVELHLQYTRREQENPPRLPNINLLLGDNGAGKSSVLRAIALVTLSPIMSQSGLVPYRLVRRKQGSALLREAEISAAVLLQAQDVGAKNVQSMPTAQMGISVMRSGDYEALSAHNPTITTDEGEIWERMYDDKSPAFLVLGYGASRVVEDAERVDVNARRKVRLLRYERVAGLFESQVARGMRKANPGRYKQVVNLINRLLPEGASFAGDYENGEYLFEVNDVQAPFGALSDGYRAYIGWIADLLYHVCMGAPRGTKLVDNYGIVLVDEIDLHLHPEWQRSVVSTVSRALPNLQFVFTTHSPILAGSLNRENIFVMETTSDGASVVKQYDERIYGLNAEQVLLSPYFNLKTTRAEPFVDELKDLSVKAGHGDLKAALAFMEKLSGQEPDDATNGTTAATIPAEDNGRRGAQPRKRTGFAAKAKRKG